MSKCMEKDGMSSKFFLFNYKKSESGRFNNQEDSLLMNNSAIEKGLFRAQALKKYFETIKKNPASSQTGIFMKPDRNKVDNLKDANYDKLTEEGYAKVETVIKDGDVIIGMVNPKPTSKEDEKPFQGDIRLVVQWSYVWVYSWD